MAYGRNTKYPAYALLSPFNPANLYLLKPYDLFYYVKPSDILALPSLNYLLGIWRLVKGVVYSNSNPLAYATDSAICPILHATRPLQRVSSLAVIMECKISEAPACFG